MPLAKAGSNFRLKREKDGAFASSPELRTKGEKACESILMN
jgi:hypothetical protein